MKLVKHQNFHAGKLTAQLLNARLGSGKTQHFFACGPGQKQRQRGLAAAGRAEEQKTRQMRGVEQSLNLSAQVRLSDKMFQIGGAQTFRQRTVHDFPPGC